MVGSETDVNKSCAAEVSEAVTETSVLGLFIITACEITFKSPTLVNFISFLQTRIFSSFLV